MDSNITPIRTRQRASRPNRDLEVQVSQLIDLLSDPQYAAYHEDARAELDRLTAQQPISTAA